MLPGADPGFPVGGGANPPGAPTYDLAKFCEKLHEIEKILFHGGGAHWECPLNPPLATFQFYSSSGSRGGWWGAEKHEIYAAAFGYCKELPQLKLYSSVADLHRPSKILDAPFLGPIFFIFMQLSGNVGQIMG